MAETDIQAGSGAPLVSPVTVQPPISLSVMGPTQLHHQRGNYGIDTTMSLKPDSDKMVAADGITRFLKDGSRDDGEGVLWGQSKK
jgi:hypothetical protein